MIWTEKEIGRKIFKNQIIFLVKSSLNEEGLHLSFIDWLRYGNLED